MNSPKIIIDKSTMPVGTADKVKSCISEVLKQRGENIHFHVVSNPEFLKVGSAVADCTKPDRIIIGTDSDEVSHVTDIQDTCCCTVEQLQEEF